MRLLRYTYTALILFAVLFSFGSCEKDNKSNLSQAVLASANSISFEGTDNDPQFITVYADGEWMSEVPEWITVSPASGNGVVEVMITVTDNLRDGTLDKNRSDVVVFKGATLASRAELVVMQAGDKYKDVKDYTLKELVALDNETIVSVPNVTVMAVTLEGFIVTDEQKSNNVYVVGQSIAEIGDKVSIMGVKSSNSQSLSIINADEVEIISSGSSVTYPVAEDITDKVDTYKATSREFIVVSGILDVRVDNVRYVTVKGANYRVSIIDAPSSLNLETMHAHQVTVKGYFDGLAAPVIKILAADVLDNGVAKEIHFFENFEWLDPWSVISNAGKSVETDNVSATAPQIPTPKIDGVSALDALLGRGYKFLRVTPATTDAAECIYLQQNYLKFGKTGFQAGIILPKLADDVPSGSKVVVSFDWCPMRQGSGVIDPVNLIVIITNGTKEVTFDVPEAGFESGHKLEWIRAEIELTGVAITKDTQITIRQTNWQLPTANRYFLDNIEISSTTN